MADKHIEVACGWVQITIPGRATPLWAPRPMVDYPELSWTDISGATVADIVKGTATGKVESRAVPTAKVDVIKATPAYVGKVTEKAIVTDPIVDADPAVIDVVP